MQIASLIFPVFAVIVTGWIVGWTGYLPRALSDALVHFAYNIAMPALLVVTIAQEPGRSLINWSFLIAFGGGSMLCFVVVFTIARLRGVRDLGSQALYGMTAAMTNTGFVALPVLRAIYGEPAVLPAAIATVFVAVVMFPATVVLLEIEQRAKRITSSGPVVLVRHILLNPMVLSTLLGMLIAALGIRLPSPVVDYLNIFADALTPCALFAIGLGLSIEGLRAYLGPSLALSVVKLILMPALVYALSVALGLDPLYTIAAVICAGVPTAKTIYILAGEYRCEEMMVASTISMTTLGSVASLIGWIYLLSGLQVPVGG